MSYLEDGFGTLVTFAGAPNIKLQEVSVTPPEYSGGGAIGVSTFRNTRYRTQAPKKLISLPAKTLTAKYDPEVYSTLLTQLQVNQLITYEFEDGSTLAIWGWIEGANASEASEGEMPTMEVTIEFSLLNDAGVETPPAYTAPA